MGNAGYRVKATGGFRSLRRENASGDGWLFDGAERRDPIVVSSSLEGVALRISDVWCRGDTTESSRGSIIVVGGVAVIG